MPWAASPGLTANEPTSRHKAGLRIRARCRLTLPFLRLLPMYAADGRATLHGRVTHRSSNSPGHMTSVEGPARGHGTSPATVLSAELGQRALHRSPDSCGDITLRGLN